MTAPLSADQQARLDRIEAAPEAEEAIRERLARAIYAAAALPTDPWTLRWDELGEVTQDHHRKVADAAIAVLRGPSVADEAVRRVEELADDLDSYVAARGRPATGSYDDGVNRAQAAVAADLRAALNGGGR